MMIIDAHCHIGKTVHAEQSPEQLVDNMARSGVEKAVICPMGKHLVCCNREGNDLIAAATRKFPVKLIGFASVNPWYGEEAIRELRRAVTELGLKGLKLHPALQGFYPHDEMVDPLMEEAVRLRLPVFFHTGTPANSLPLQVGEVAERFGELCIIMGHTGYYDYCSDALAVAKRNSNVVLETSHFFDYEFALEAAGKDRVVFGSDSPFQDCGSELKRLECASFRDDVKELISGANIKRILGL